MKYAFTLTAVIVLSACTPFQPYTENSSDRYYIVQPGDSFHSIAFVLETTPGQLQRANPWANSGQLQPGMRLSVPQTDFDNGFATVETDNHGHPKYAPDDI
jgi:spore germination protein YaaH